ncbi:uncharacterized protein [Antedon mediterranea]|uniref:uncharacterized protein n=1 Tax=Antedon mediterranea TaxID=105859 RepID=UPI003AF9B813
MAQKHTHKDDIKKNIKELLEKESGEIPINDLATKYNTYFKKDIVLRRYGINGIKCIPDVFNCFEIVKKKGTAVLRLKKQVVKVPKENVKSKPVAVTSNQGSSVTKKVEKTVKSKSASSTSTKKVQETAQTVSQSPLLPLMGIDTGKFFSETLENTIRSLKDPVEKTTTSQQPVTASGFFPAHQMPTFGNITFGDNVTLPNQSFGQENVNRQPRSEMQINNPSQLLQESQQKEKDLQQPGKAAEFSQHFMSPAHQMPTFGNITFGNNVTLPNQSFGQENVNLQPRSEIQMNTPARSQQRHENLHQPGKAAGFSQYFIPSAYQMPTFGNIVTQPNQSFGQGTVNRQPRSEMAMNTPSQLLQESQQIIEGFPLSPQRKRNIQSSKPSVVYDNLPQNILDTDEFLVGVNSQSSNYWPSLNEGATMKKKDKKKKDPKAESENRRIKFDHLDVSTLQQTRGRKRPTREELNSRASFHIQALSEQNEHVSIELVMKGVREYFGQNNIKQLGLNRETDLEVIREHQRLLCRINAYISAFCKCRSIATLFELLEDLHNIQEGKDSFEDLNVGPLSKFPEVYNVFKFPPYQSDQDIIKVTTMDILGLLKEHMSRKDLWRTKVDLKEFMEYIMSHYEVSDPYQLGIRVQSVALGVSVIKKAQREEKTTMEQCRKTIVEQLKQEVEASLQSVKKSILDPANVNRESSKLDNRKRYADMTAGEAILKVFENARPLLEHEPRLRSLFRALPAVVNNEVARNLFHLAVCLGSMEIPEEYQPGYEEEAVETINALDNKVEQEPVCTNKIPDEDEIISDIGQFLNKIKEVPNLKDLCLIEIRLCKSKKVSSFLDLKKGTFLQFLTKTPKLLQQFGGSIIGTSSSLNANGTPYHPSTHDLTDFIRQCGKQNMNDVKAVETALCEHFQTTSVDTIGKGSIQLLVSKAKNIPQNDEQNCVTYEQAVCSQNRKKGFSAKNFGLRGHQSVCNAMLVLNSTPLLNDFADWSQWDLIFKPEHGELKHFIEKWSGVMVPCEQDDYQLNEPIKILALETRPGVLLKLASETSVDLFKTSAIQGDARLTAGHLVSIVTKDGIQNAPLNLLQNHYELALNEILAKDYMPVPGGPPEKSDSDIKVVTFVLDCLVLLPTNLCFAVSEVFLKPLSTVIGDKRSKKLLNEACMTTNQLNRMQRLGFLLGIVEWSETFDLKLKNPNFADNYQNDDDESIDIADLLPETENDQPEILELEREEDISDESENFSETDTDETPPATETPSSVDETPPATESNENELSSSSENLKEKDPEIEKNDDIKSLEETGEGEDTDKENEEVDVQSEEETAADDEIVEPVTPLTPRQIEMQECKAIVDKIRKDEFGINAVLNKDGEELIARQKLRIARSLERLSSELYTKDTHFVLELVQNADDNTYKEQCQLPSLLFVLEDGSITVYNNERGFSGENIQALCDVGKSTKGKHKYGYIGHKGIGFKSVFRVTDRPEIHSNGFHICFDRQTDPLGYILPTWIGASKPRDVTEEDDDDSKGWQTRILLPLKSDVCKTNKLLNRFDDIQPSLLLFLHRLRSIQVVNQPKHTKAEMKRIDHPKSVIEIKHTNGTDFWLVVRDMINVDESMCDRANMESTELALAFPLPKDKSISEVVMKDQYVFAYLPLRSYGFKFIIQGDFDIPSSREDVDSDSAWNQWIKQHLPALFIKALQYFKEYYGCKDEELAVCRFLQFVPVEGQILGFFESVAKEIHQKLKSSPCLPVVSPDDTGSTIWKQPSQAIIHDPLVQELVSSTALNRHLDCYYLSNTVSKLLNASLLKSLGVKTITTTNLISLFKGEVLQAKANGVCLKIDSVAKWLTCIYRCRDMEHDISEEPIKEIQALPIIPLSNGMWTNLEDKSVFFSLTFENQRTDIYAEKKSIKKQMQGNIQTLESDMNILHGDLLTCQDGVGNSQVMLMMEQLGICHITPYDVIHNHILPTLKSEDWKNKSPAVCVSYVVYIKEEMQNQPNICKWEDLKELVQVRTDKGTFVNPNKEPVHFTMKYGNKYDLKNDFKGGEWTFLDECYLTCGKRGIGHEWKIFLEKLGVLSLIAIERKTLTLQKCAMDSSVWVQEYDKWPVSSDGCYHIEDCRSKELETLIENNTKSNNPSSSKVMVNLLNMLGKEWNYFREFTNAFVVIDNDRKRQIDSSFAKLLLKSSWIPTTSVINPDGSRTDNRLLPPNQAFLFSTRLYAFLNNHVPYLEGRNLENVELKNFLQMKGENKIEDINFIYSMLQEWCTRGKDYKPDEKMKSGATFATSIDHMFQVYIHLQLHSPPDKLETFFASFPAIFVPTQPCYSRNIARKIVIGTFVSKSMTYWEDPIQLFQTYSSLDKHSLSGIYEERSDFFQRHIKVDDTPNMLEYLQLLVKISSENELPNKVVHSHVLKIFGILGEKCAISGSTYHVPTDLDTTRAAFLKSNLKSYKVFPTKANKWVCLEDQPMIADEGSQEMEEMFASEPCVNLLLLDDSSSGNVRQKRRNDAQGMPKQENIQRFLKACGVKHLSECMEQEPIQENTKLCPKLQNVMHRIVPYIQTFLFSNFEEVHQILVEDFKIKSKLKIMNFMTADRLEVAYRLLDYSKEKVIAAKIPKKSCAISKNFYINKSLENSVETDNSVRKEIARFFSCSNHTCQKELQRFLILVMQQSEGIGKDFIKQEGLSRLDEGVELWAVEKAEEPKPIPPPPKPVKVEPLVKEDANSAKPIEKDNGGIHSWPPKSSAYGVIHTEKGKNTAEEASLKHWPPPQPAQVQLDTQPRQIVNLQENDLKTTTKEASLEHSPQPGHSQLNHMQQPTTRVNEQDIQDFRGLNRIPNSNIERQVNDGQPQTTTNPGNLFGNTQQTAIAASSMNSHPGIAGTYGMEKLPNLENKSMEGRPSHVADLPVHNLPRPVHTEGSQFQTPPNPQRTVHSGMFSGSLSTAVELVEEELKPDLLDLSLPDHDALNNQPSPKDELVGKYGEKLVYHLLKNQYDDNATVRWVNEEYETGLPYDIEIQTVGEKACIEYVEVKATNSSEKKFFEISSNEVAFAQQQMPNYHLYRVYNTLRKESVRVCHLKNLGDKMNRRQVVLLMKI